MCLQVEKDNAVDRADAAEEKAKEAEENVAKVGREFGHTKDIVVPSTAGGGAARHAEEDVAGGERVGQDARGFGEDEE